MGAMDLTSLFQLATARISAVGEKAIFDIESGGGSASSTSFGGARKAFMLDQTGVIPTRKG